MAEKPSGYKNPPVLSETKSYQQWSKQLNIWQMITDIDKKKIALVVILSLSGKARVRLHWKLRLVRVECR